MGMTRLEKCIVASAILLAAPSPMQAQQQQPSPQQQQPTAWSQLPRMQLERQFAGPLQDTVIQRWRDPADGTVCYIYLPISAPHSLPTAAGYVQYGSSSIGSISCSVAPPAPVAPVAQQPPS